MLTFRESESQWQKFAFLSHLVLHFIIKTNELTIQKSFFIYIHSHSSPYVLNVELTCWFKLKQNKQIRECSLFFMQLFTLPELMAND